MENLKKLVEAFRSSEGPNHRGPCFVQLALGIESVLKVRVVTREELHSILGPPDLADTNGENAAYVFRFDHREPGKNRDEWYFSFKGERLTASGYNQAGINDVSDMKPHT